MTIGNGVGATVAAQDIARLADVGRAAVSNWRRRFPDFPEPVGGTSASPLYSLAEVEAWLTRHGKQFRLQPGDRVWQRIRGTVDDLQLGDLVSCLGAFLVFLQRDAERWKALANKPDGVVAEELASAVAAAIPELPGGVGGRWDPAWVGLSRLVAEAADQPGHKELFEFLCDRYVEVHSRRVTVTPRQIAELMVDLAEVRDGVVLDPACGIGTLLLISHTRGAAALRGQELNPTAARLSAARSLLHDTRVRVAAGDSLRADAFPDERVDAAVCDPPFSERSWGYDELASDPRWGYGLPPKGEPELAWAQHCLARVRPGGRVVIMMPAGAASRRPGRRIRGNLLRAGALRAVIRLPAAGSGSVAAPDLWIMQRPGDAAAAASHVLVVDASADAPVAAEAWWAFRATPEGALPDVARAVRIIDLLDDDIDLSPPRHVRRVASGAEPARFASIRSKLLALPGPFGATLPELATPKDGRPLPMASVDELAKAGLVVIHQAPLRTAVDGGDAPALTVKDVRRCRPPSGATVVGPGSVIIEPGDVIVPLAAPEPVVRVADEEGAVLGPQLLLFRLDQERLDPHFFAGFLRAARASAGSGSFLSTRTDIRRTPIPRLPIAEQRSYGEAFRNLIGLEDQIREIASLGNALVRLGFVGLADGSLQPTGD